MKKCSVCGDEVQEVTTLKKGALWQKNHELCSECSEGIIEIFAKRVKRTMIRVAGLERLAANGRRAHG